ncbi:hypothetical protein C2845_PM05G19940 [Panicum miliaceum]|uniref:RNase H type-1 domain-containing protein n=1 Tax=Panicum miliaceum TaxID=4540 RepID=A0A3L6T1C8_PANMI|nr:hypothetical protein C2845_PM05G19940 [Panicum miliaceum]
MCSLTSSFIVTEHILELPDEKKLLTVGLLWAWWDARNKANARDKRRSTEEVIYKAQPIIIHAQQEGAGRSLNAGRAHDQRWIPPTPDVWKINVDAAFWEKESSGAWGFVVRDSQSDAVLAGAGKLVVVKDVLCAEAHACVAVLQAAAAQPQGMQNIILETDSLTLVKALKTMEYD